MKRKKSAVQYSKGMPRSHCGRVSGWPEKGDCEYFQSPDGCQKVEGTIMSDYWCTLWESKDEDGKTT
jgi:hypothetical protein